MATTSYIKSKERYSAQGVSPVSLSDAQGAVRQHGGSPGIASTVLMMLTDVAVIVGAFALVLLFHFLVLGHIATLASLPVNVTPDISDGWYLLGFLLLLMVVLRRYGLYTGVPNRSGVEELRLIAQACLTAGILLCGWLYLVHNRELSRVLVVTIVAMTAVALGIRRAMWRHVRFKQYARGVETRNVVIMGTHHLSAAMAQHIESDYHLGYQLCGFMEAPGCSGSGEVQHGRVLGSLDRLRELVRLHFIDEIVITEHCQIETVVELVEEARDLDIDVRALSGLFGDLTQNAEIEYLGIYPVVTLHRRNPRVIALFLKRVVDIALSLAALIAVFPMMLVIVIAVVLDSRGPIFYVSERIGKRGRVFPCFKFRTMVPDAEARKRELMSKNERDGILFKMTNDPRVTRVGRILRKYSLDELPQFFNVLRGEMSIVGPRPPIASEVAKYALEHFRRLEVLPGLTGLWQVQARHDSSFARYIALDTAYVENWSFWLDLKIMIQTAQVVIRGSGA
jgi:exopolysaccharide biosynthesis polyprenyl glycosylphosphotransferase